MAAPAAPRARGRRRFGIPVGGLGGLRKRAARLAAQRDARFVGISLALFVLLRFYQFIEATTQSAPDTDTYTMVADRWGIFDPSFYGAPRPFVLPLLYQITGSRQGWAVAQWIIATGAWAFLALVIASGLAHRRVRIAAFFTILAVALATPVAVWDRVLLTESLTVSLAAVALAAIALVMRRASPAKFAWLAVLLVVWAFVRDANAPVAALVLVPLAVVLLVQRRRALAGAFLAAAVVLLVVSQISINAGQRWEWSMMNVIGVRVLPSPPVRDYFVSHGMPYDASVSRLSGYYSGTNGSALFHNQPLLNWVRKSGRTTYASYLLTHPGYSIYWPAKDPELLAPGTSNYEDAAMPILPETIETTIYPSSAGRALFLLVVALTAAGAMFRYRRREWILPVVVILTTPLHLAFVWHSDPSESGRHAVLASVLLRVAALWLLLLAADAWLSRRSGKRAAAPATQSPD
jgi:hypothetical protein